MGMDVCGIKPTSEPGEYFCANVWWWRPLATYIEKIAPDIAGKCRHWQSNDGDGLGEQDALTLAERLQAELDSGRTKVYEKRYRSAQEMAPDEPCDLCEGTGTRKPVPEIGAGDAITGIKCNKCDGSGTMRPYWTMYPFSTDTVCAFVAFLQGCGGFRIY
jgi:hypothetical protein